MENNTTVSFTRNYISLHFVLQLNFYIFIIPYLFSRNIHNSCAVISHAEALCNFLNDRDKSYNFIYRFLFDLIGYQAVQTFSWLSFRAISISLWCAPIMHFIVCEITEIIIKQLHSAQNRFGGRFVHKKLL